MALDLTKRNELTRRLTSSEVDQNWTDIETQFNGLQLDAVNYTGWSNYEDTVYTTGSPYTLTVAAGQVAFPNNANTSVVTQIPSDITTFYYATELSFTGLTGTFVVGETVTGGTSGATGVIAVVNVSSLYLNNLSATAFVDTETITGGTSAATATLNAAPTGGKLTGQNGDAYNLVLEFKIRPTTAASNVYIETVIDIGGGIGDLYPFRFDLARGSGVAHFFLKSFSFYTLDTWEANGGEIQIQVFNSTVEIYDIRTIVFRTHKAR